MNPLRPLFLSLSRMPPIIMLFIILGLAVIVTMYVMGVVTSKDEQVKRIEAINEANNSRTVKVVYASKNIEDGEVISQEALEEKDVLATKAPVDAFNTSNAVVGQTAAFPIPAGTILSNHSIKPMGLPAAFDGRIKDGMRALTFGVDTNSGVAGFIAPGSHVDILAITGAAETVKAAPVLSDVEVVAVGTTYQRAPGSTSANPAGSVTVALAPEDGIKLVRSLSAAKLYLALRNEKDHTPVAIVDVKDLFPKHSAIATIASNIPDPILPPPPPLKDLNHSSDGAAEASTSTPMPPPMHEIEMWNGSKKDVLSVPQG